MSDDETRVVAGVGNSLQPGHRFGSRYLVNRLLGVGGMGAVYQAWDQALEVLVALKVIRPATEPDPESARDLERRFKRELLLARQITHRNVVRIHDLGEIDGVTYITMPYIEGSDLATILKHDGRLPLDRALAIARDVASGLMAAHQAGVVHRDLKPANIMVGADGVAVIMDFGIAHSTSAAFGNTTTGAIVGTFGYMAPEQARGGPVDERADIFAFGVILRDMLGEATLPSVEAVITRIVSTGHRGRRSLYASPSNGIVCPAMNELRELRRVIGLGQRAFAALLSIPLETYRPWDSGRRVVSAAVLQRAREAVIHHQRQHELLPLDQLARELHVHPRTLQAAARTGRLDAHFSVRSAFGRPIRRASRAAGDQFIAKHYRCFSGQAVCPPPLHKVPDDYDEHLRALRRRMRLTQDALARRIGAAGKAVVYQWESRKRSPSPVLCACLRY